MVDFDENGFSFYSDETGSSGGASGVKKIALPKDDTEEAFGNENM